MTITIIMLIPRINKCSCISVREKPRWVEITVEIKCEKDESILIRERQKWRDTRARGEGEEEVEWWADWRRCEGRLIHKTNAELNSDWTMYWILSFISLKFPSRKGTAAVSIVYYRCLCCNSLPKRGILLDRNHTDLPWRNCCVQLWTVVQAAEIVILLLGVKALK